MTWETPPTGGWSKMLIPEMSNLTKLGLKPNCGIMEVMTNSSKARISPTTSSDNECFANFGSPILWPRTQSKSGTVALVERSCTSRISAQVGVRNLGSPLDRGLIFVSPNLKIHVPDLTLGQDHHGLGNKFFSFLVNLLLLPRAG